MKTLILTIMLTLTLGCTGIRNASDPIAYFGRKCEDLGFRPNTQEYRECVYRFAGDYLPNVAY